MKTSIAGDLQKEELGECVNAVREKFQGNIGGFFNSKPASYKLSISGSSEGYVEIDDEFIGDWHDYIPRDEWKGFKREFSRSGTREFRYMHVIAFLFPYHDLALILDSYRFENIPQGSERLRDLGYTLVAKNEDKYSVQWGIENQLELLSNLRSPDLKEVKATDRRTTQIIDEVFSHLPLEPVHITFAVYSPQRKGRKYRSELVANPVKKLVKTPFEWRNESLESIGKGLSLERAIGLTSLVETSSGTKHIPMIDFNCQDASGIYGALKTLGISGIIIASGNSYHFYGFNLFSEDEWKSYIESLNSSWAVDHKWTELQLKQGYSMLRITPTKRKLYQPCLIEVYKPTVVMGKHNFSTRSIEYRLTG